MLDNATRRQLLERHKASGFPGSIIDVYNAYNQGIDLISQFEMSNQPQMQVANTPQQQQEGLRPFHQQGQTNQSMAFPNVPPNTNFNTVGMKAPINIKKIDNQGNLVKSYENVPPGIQSLPTGPVGGTVIETPANMQSGGVKSDSKAVRSSQWPPELDFLDQEERFRRSLTGNVLPPAEVIGHRSIPEKNRRVDEKAHYADGTMNVDKFIAMGKLTGWKPWIMDIVHNGYSGHDRTAQDENVIEFFDGTGISSWDDAARAYIDWEVSDRTFPTFTEAGNILSAFPGANIIKGAKFGLTKFQKLKNIYARTVKGNNYINAAEDARQELIESKSNKKYGGVRKYQSGSSPDPDLAPGIAQLPVADVQTDRVPYSKISDNSRMMGVGWAKPFFETAGNNPDSKLYKIGQRILDEREQDLARAEMALEFTSVPGLMRTAERLKGKDPLRTIAKEGKLDLLSTLPLAGGMYKGLRLAEKSAGDLGIIKSLASKPAIQGTANLLQEIKGELLHGTQNRNAIARGNKKFQDWIQSPEVQAKVSQRYDDIISKKISKKEALLEEYNPQNRNFGIEEDKQSYLDAYNKLEESLTQDIARLRETKDAVLNFTPSAKEYSLKNQIKENLAQYAGSKLKPIHHGNYGVNYTHGLEPKELSLLSSGKLDEFEKSMKNRYPDMLFEPTSRYQGKTYVSRSHKGKLKDQAKRESITMHEDTHNWMSETDMYETGQYDVGLDHLSQRQLKNLNAYGSGVELSKEEEYLAYLTKPTEQHARIMELRGHYGLKPGQQVSPEVAEKILKDIIKNTTPIDSNFAEVVEWNPNRLAGLFNNFWMAPAAGTVAVAAADADAKPIKAINKYGGKYPSLPNKVPYYNKLKN